MQRELGFGVIGLSQGGYAEYYTSLITQIKGVEVKAICDLGASEPYVRECLESHKSSGELAETYGATLYHELDELLADPRVDIVMITSEVRDHAAHAIKAIEAGKHVFVAKPAAMNAMEVTKISRAAQGKDLVVLAGEPARYEEAMVIAMNQIRSGAIGKPLMARSFINHPAMTEPSWEREVARSGGPLVEFATYCCDVLWWAMDDDPVEVMAYGANFLHPNIDGIDNLKAVVKFKGGAIGSMDMCSSISWQYPFLDLEVIGEKGAVRTNYHNYPVVTHYGQQQATLAEPRLSPMNMLEIQHFVACVRGQERPRFGLAEAFRVAEMVDALSTSLRSGAPVRLRNS